MRWSPIHDSFRYRNPSLCPVQSLWSWCCVEECLQLGMLFTRVQLSFARVKVRFFDEPTANCNNMRRHHIIKPLHMGIANPSGFLSGWRSSHPRSTPLPGRHCFCCQWCQGDTIQRWWLRPDTPQSSPWVQFTYAFLNLIIFVFSLLS